MAKSRCSDIGRYGTTERNSLIVGWEHLFLSQFRDSVKSHLVSEVRLVLFSLEGFDSSAIVESCTGIESSRRKPSRLVTKERDLSRMNGITRASLRNNSDASS